LGKKITSRVSGFWVFALHAEQDNSTVVCQKSEVSQFRFSNWLQCVIRNCFVICGLFSFNMSWILAMAWHSQGRMKVAHFCRHILNHLFRGRWQPGAGTFNNAIPAFPLSATGGCQGKGSLIGVLCANPLSLIWILRNKTISCVWSSTSRGAVCVVSSVVLALIREGRYGEQRLRDRIAYQKLCWCLLDAFFLCLRFPKMVIRSFWVSRRCCWVFILGGFIFHGMTREVGSEVKPCGVGSHLFLGFFGLGLYCTQLISLNFELLV